MLDKKIIDDMLAGVPAQSSLTDGLDEEVPVEKEKSVWEPFVDKNAVKYPNVPANVVKGLIERESSWNPSATADTKKAKYGYARGLGQFIDETASRYIPDWKGPQDSYKPHKNIEGIFRYLDDLIKSEGSIEKALVRYHGGGEDVLGTKSDDYAQQIQGLAKKYVSTAPVETVKKPIDKSILDEMLATKKPLTDTATYPKIVPKEEKPVSVSRETTMTPKGEMVLGDEYLKEPTVIPAAKSTTDVQQLPLQGLPQYAPSRAIGKQEIKAGEKPPSPISGIKTRPPVSDTRAGALAAGAINTLPFVELKGVDVEKAKKEFPSDYTIGTVAGNVLQTIAAAGPIGSTLAKVPAIAKSPLLLNTLTRMTTGGLMSAGQQEWKENFKESLLNTAESAGAGAISVIPEVFVPAAGKKILLQLIAQPLTDVMYDVGIGKLRGKSKEEIIKQALLDAALGTGFAIKDVSSGKVFREQQRGMKDELKNWMKGKGNEGYELIVGEDFETRLKHLSPEAQKRIKELDVSKILAEQPTIGSQGQVVNRVPIKTTDGDEIGIYTPKTEAPEGIDIKATQRMPTLKTVEEYPGKIEELKIDSDEQGRLLETGKAEAVPERVAANEPVELAQAPKPEEQIEKPVTPEQQLKERVQAEQKPKGQSFTESYGDVLAKKTTKDEKPAPKLSSEEGRTALFTPSKPSVTGDEITLHKPHEVFERLKFFVKKMVNPKEKAVSPEVHKANIEKVGEVAADMLDIESVIKDYDSAVNRYAPKRDLNDDEVHVLNEVLQGRASSEGLPEDLGIAVKKMRDFIDNMSTRLQQSGATTEDMNIIIDNNKGLYVTRSFMKWADPKWSKHVSQERVNAAANYLKNSLETKNSEILDKIGELENRKLELQDSEKIQHIDDRIATLKEQIVEPSKDNIELMINDLLRTDKSPMMYFSEGIPLGKKNISILKQKGEYPQEIIDLWGEIKDPRANFYNSALKISQLIANHKFLKRVEAIGKDKFLFENKTIQNGIKYDTQLGSETSKTYDPLAKYYTTKDIRDVFYESKNMINDPLLKSVYRTYMKGVGLAKAGLTIYYPQTQVKNLFSNIGFALLNGHVDFRTDFKTLQKKFENKEEWHEFMKDLTRRGVTDESVGANEMMAIFKDAGFDDLDYLLSKKHQRRLRAILKAPNKAYMAADNLWKIRHFIHEYENYKKVYKGTKTDDEIKQIAAENTRAAMPTWSENPEIMKQMRKVPVVGTFMSFNYQAIRTTINSIKLAKKEMADPVTREIGVKRLAGALAYAGMVFGAEWLGKTALGINETDDKKLRKFMPDWDKTGSLYFKDKRFNENGSPIYDYTNINSYAPHGAILDAVQAAIHSDNPTDAILKSAYQIIEPFVSEDVLLQTINELKNNKSETGKFVWDEYASDEQKVLQTINYVGSKLIGPYKIASNLYKGAKGEETFFKKYDLKKEAIAASTGIRNGQINVEKVLESKIFDFVNEKNKLEYGSKRRPPEQSTKEAMRMYDELSDNINIAISLGVKRSVVKDLLKKRSISEELSNKLINGTYRSYIMKKQRGWYKKQQTNK